MIFPIGDDQVQGGYLPIFSYGFIFLNVVIFVWQILLPVDQINIVHYTYGAIPVEILSGEGSLTLFTSLFLHAGIMHILGNMVFLWVFADNIEATIGSFYFLLFYILGGLAAHAAHIYFNPTSTIPTIGASGAIAAVLGAYLIMYPKSRIKALFFIFPFYIPAFLFLGIWIVQQLANVLVPGDTGATGVAWWAHIGGFVFGIIGGIFFRQLGFLHTQRSA